MNELLVDRLKNARAESGLKQQEVAEKLGIKANTISNWEQGRTEPDIDTFVKLCNIYQIDCSSLLADVYAFKRIGSDISLSEYNHIKKYRDLDVHGKKMVDFTLNEEWERSTEIVKENALKEKENLVSVSKYAKEGENKNNTVEFSEELTPDKDYLLPNAAHDRTDIEVTEEMKESDDKVFDDF